MSVKGVGSYPDEKIQHTHPKQGSTGTERASCFRDTGRGAAWDQMKWSLCANLRNGSTSGEAWKSFHMWLVFHSLSGTRVASSNHCFAVESCLSQTGLEPAR